MKALIFGVTGQDGSYLAERLPEDWEIHGTMRESSSVNTARLEVAMSRPKPPILHFIDPSDHVAVIRIVDEVRPDIVFNVTGPTRLDVCAESPLYALRALTETPIRIMEAIRLRAPNAHFFQASSAQMFGSPDHVPQSERTPFNPKSPYGIAKLAAHWAVKYYRDHFGMFACSGIMFDHTSSRQSPAFLPRKITQAAASIALDRQDTVSLGNIRRQRDWGYAPDVMKAALWMLQQNEPDDYVIGTECAHTVRDFLTIAFGSLGLDWSSHVKIETPPTRTGDIRQLTADCYKLKTKAKYEPSLSFDKMVKQMVAEDYEHLKTHGRFRF